MKMGMVDGLRWCLTWRQVAHTSSPLTQGSLVEKIVVDELEERKTGRGRDGLVGERMYK